MKFLRTRFIQSLLKKAVVAFVSVITGPKLAPILSQFGVTIDPAQAQVGVFAALEGLRMWLTHQKWTPKWLSKLL